MKPDDFEKRLQRQPLREIPPEWREQILKGATASLHASAGPRPSFLSTVNSHLSTLLWPNAKAWAGLAAVWVLIFIIRFDARDHLPVMATISKPSRVETIARLKDQQKILTELIGGNEPREIDKPRVFSPQPHSELRGPLSMA